MKKLLILCVVLFAALQAATTPGVIHFIYDNGTVTTSGEDTFYEFDILAYLSGTVNDSNRLLGAGIVYIEYDTDIFGSLIAGTSSLEYKKIGLLAGHVPDNESVDKYYIYNSNNRFTDVYSIAFEASVTGSPDIFGEMSTDPQNPSGLFHIKMKAKAAGSGSVSFPETRINGVHDQFFSYANLQYEGPMDFSAAVEAVEIQGPVTGEPYTAIELESLDAAYKGGMVRIKWKTASETENLGFILKRAVVGGGGQTGIYEEIDSYVNNEKLKGAGTTEHNTTYMYFDKTVKPGTKYAYVLQDVDYEGHIRESEPLIVNIPENQVIKSDEFVFSSGYPNPFNPSFIVPFELYSPQSVDIRLYDMTGRQVRVIADSEMPAGNYNILVDGSDLSSGTYLLRARIDNAVKTQKMLLVK